MSQAGWAGPNGTTPRHEPDHRAQEPTGIGTATRRIVTKTIMQMNDAFSNPERLQGELGDIPSLDFEILDITRSVR